MAANRVSLIIPAYNEEKRITKTIIAYYDYLQKHFQNFELIVVCNNCSDNTPTIVQGLTKKLKKLKCLNFPYYTGKGGAVIEGFKKARFELIGFVDADNSTAPKEFDKLVRAIEEYNIDCALGSRALKESILIVKQPFTRRLLGKIFSIIVQLLFGLNVRDTQCGAKIFRREAIKAILPELKINGFAFDVEILWKLKNHGFSYKEIPIVWKNDRDSKVGFSAPLKMFKELIKIKFNL